MIRVSKTKVRLRLFFLEVLYCLFAVPLLTIQIGDGAETLHLHLLREPTLHLACIELLRQE